MKTFFAVLHHLRTKKNVINISLSSLLACIWFKCTTYIYVSWNIKAYFPHHTNITSENKISLFIAFSIFSESKKKSSSVKLIKHEDNFAN